MDSVEFATTAHNSKPQDVSVDADLSKDISTKEYEAPCPQPDCVPQEPMSEKEDVDRMSKPEGTQTKLNRIQNPDNDSFSSDDSRSTSEIVSRGRHKSPRDLHVAKVKYQVAQTAKRSGLCIKKKVEEYIRKTGARAYFQAEFKSDRMTHTFVAGKPWRINSVNDSSEAVTKGALDICVEAAVKKHVQSLIDEHGRIQLPLETSSTQKVANQETCLVCKCSLESPEKNKPVAIGCSGEGSSPCDAWVHGYCLGFPDLLQRQIARMPDFFCPNHLSTRSMDITGNPEGYQVTSNYQDTRNN